ncbi:MAG: hypothetical protein O3A37_09635 [Planctomycetota bacterium]|nr:hypothetical protein [Planctomycetota bacterium]
MRLVGYLSLLEAWFLLTLPLRIRELVATCWMPGVRGFTLLWIGWMVGAAGADFAHATPFPLAARGFSRVFFLGFVCLCLVPQWLARPRRLEAFVAGAPIAHLIGLKYFRSGTATIDGIEIDAADLGWETWTNYFLLSIVMAVIARLWRWSPWACAALTAATGSVNLMMGSRSAGRHPDRGGRIDAVLHGAAAGKAWAQRRPCGGDPCHTCLRRLGHHHALQHPGC